MAHYSKVLEGLSVADPELLVGSDEYVLACRTCPANLPNTVAQHRLMQLHLVATNILSEAAEDDADLLVSQVASWVRKADIEADSLSNEALSIGVSNHDGRWNIHLPDEVIAQLREKGFAPEAFLTTFNDQRGAAYTEELSDGLNHVAESHPGIVRCGGPVEATGKLACGGVLETIPCPHEEGLGESVVMVSIQRSRAAE